MSMGSGLACRTGERQSVRNALSRRARDNRVKANACRECAGSFAFVGPIDWPGMSGMVVAYHLMRGDWDPGTKDSVSLVDY